LEVTATGTPALNVLYTEVGPKGRRMSVSGRRAQSMTGELGAGRH
jgi:hypothetical protein